MITSEKLQIIATSIAVLPLDETTITQLRTQFPDIHFTYCMDDDVSGVQPKFESANFNLYLIDGREHCLCLTKNYEDASGVLVAEIIDD